jgi:hypothetical protein
MSIAAHPGSAKTELRWLEWTAPFDGLEWLNGDSEWRDESMPTLMRTLFTYPFRGPEALASVLDRPQTVLARWDVLTGRRRVVALAAADAHARLGLRSAGEAFDGPASRLEIPSYEKTFRAFSIALPGAMLTGNARADAAAVLEAIRGGRVYSTIDALAAPGLFSFAATAGNDRAEMGDVLTAGRPVTFRVETNAPSDARITLLRDGNPVITADGASLQHGESGQPGVYRVEVHLPGAAGDPPVPWILSNPIYVRPEDAGKRALLPRAPATEFLERDPDAETSDWTIETSARSQGALDVVKAAAGTQLLFRFGLAGTRSDSPYAAAVMPAGPGLSGYDRVIFTARAAQPMRLSVQLRVPAGSRAERWHRSVYVDQMPREVVVFFDEMTPRGPTERRRPELSNVRDVLFVVDTVNTAPGTSGQIWIDDVKYGK